MFRKFWRVVYPAFLLFAVYLAVYIAAMPIYDAFFSSTLPDLNSFMIRFGDIISIAALIGGGVISFLIYKRDYVVSSDAVLKAPMNFVWIALCGILASHGLSIMVSILGMTGVLGTYDQTEQMINTSGVLITALKSVILAPIAEELTFRGLVFRRMKEYSSFWPAALVSSVLFGLYHMNIMQGIFAFIFGLLLCAIYDHFHNLCTPICMHAAANAVSIILQVIGVDYQSIPLAIAVMAVTLALSACGLFFIIKKTP